ncbi:hypothetical protein BCR39DRAFT_520946 [Naematelia encephala]|uniref:Alpha/Beta hydrolase protein n=1 Tax=Naematelia encephala TaxID=71784 RepID=A0A1Y2BDZ5_9TREE|nr:hypothetical protein BCR39DRAFT_520946 [Naematelia encephala]
MTDYASLNMGHPATSCRLVLLAGFQVKVYGLDEIRSSDLPIACIIATHGRLSNQKRMSNFVYGLLGHIGQISQGKKKKRDVIVVTLDQRNHGDRLVDGNANLAYDKNPQHLFDMASSIVGGCQDVSMIIDFLACYLFPNGERVIDEWVATGVSLGGHVVWRLLHHEPRIKHAIPILGVPLEAFTRLMGTRATSQGLEFAPPLYPPSLRPLLEVPIPEGCYSGKKILSIHGGSDPVVPFELGRDDIMRVKEEFGGQLELFVQDGIGHAVTFEMLQKTAEWVWLWALSANKPSTASQL